MQSIHIFQRIERVLRMRPDSHRWRVTLREDVVEVFRRPILTSAVTLGALGLTDAPMPVPICVLTIQVIAGAQVHLCALVSGEESIVPVHVALAQALAVVDAWVDAG